MIREVRPAGFWRRGVALGIDWLWLFCLAGTLAIVLFGVALPSGARGIGQGVGIAVWCLHYIMPAVIVVLAWWWFGATPGKYLVELRVVDHQTGRRPAFWRLVLRCIGYVLSALPLGLGFVMAVFNHDRRALHDFIAGTRVIVVEDTDLDLVTPGVAP